MRNLLHRDELKLYAYMIVEWGWRFGPRSFGAIWFWVELAKWLRLLHYDEGTDGVHCIVALLSFA